MLCSVIIEGVGLDAHGFQRRKITMCKYTDETVLQTMALLLPALVDKEVVHVKLDVMLPITIEGEINLV